METKDVELHRITSTAIIRKDGKYLIVKRSPNKKVFPNRWTVPGGGLELSDYVDTPKTTPEAWYYALETSLKREVIEEVNLEIDNLKYLLDLVFLPANNIPVITFSYYADWKSGEVKLNDENVEYVWVTAEEAKNYDLISGIAQEIEMTDRILKGEKNVKFSYKK